MMFSWVAVQASSPKIVGPHYQCHNHLKTHNQQIILSHITGIEL